MARQPETRYSIRDLYLDYGYTMDDMRAMVTKLDDRAYTTSEPQERMLLTFVHDVLERTLRNGLRPLTMKERRVQGTEP